MPEYSLNKDELTSDELLHLTDYDGAISEVIKKNIQNALTAKPLILQTGIFAIDNFEKLFSFDGSLRTKDDPAYGYYADFFKKKGRRSKKQPYYMLRGSRYLISVDPALEVRQKLKIIYEDFIDAIDILTLDGTDIMHKNFIEQSAILDYMKNASITLFNALIQREKIGEFNLDDQRYQVLRSSIYTLAQHSTRAYYAHLVGDNNSYADALTAVVDRYEELSMVIKYIEEQYRGGIFSSRYFTRPEASHPLIILASTYTAVNNVRHTPDTVIGLPSGGTELAIAQQLAYFYLRDVMPDLLFVPLSLHSIKDAFGSVAIQQKDFIAFLNANIDYLQDKRILIVEDNSSTGRTIQTLVDLLNEDVKPEDVGVSVAEADIIRSQIDLHAEHRKYIASAETYTHSVGILPISRVLRPKVDLKEIAEKKRIVKKYEMKLADANGNVEILLYRALLEMVKHPTQELLHTLNEDNAILSFRHTFLSNFYSAPVRYNGVLYQSVEHAYQAQKFTPQILRSVSSECLAEINETMRRRGHPVHFDEATMIFENEHISSGNTKVIADILRAHGYVRSGWDDDKLKIMATLLLEKFKHEDVRKQLVQTGNKYLVEGNTWDDTLWGVSGGRGKNLLGLLLMEIRKDNALLNNS